MNSSTRVTQTCLNMLFIALVVQSNTDSMSEPSVVEFLDGVSLDDLEIPELFSTSGDSPNNVVVQMATHGQSAHNNEPQEIGTELQETIPEIYHLATNHKVIRDTVTTA